MHVKFVAKQTVYHILCLIHCNFGRQQQTVSLTVYARLPAWVDPKQIGYSGSPQAASTVCGMVRFCKYDTSIGALQSMLCTKYCSAVRHIHGLVRGGGGGRETLPETALGESLLVMPVPCPADVGSLTAGSSPRLSVDPDTRVVSRCPLVVTPFSGDPRSSGVTSKPLCPADWEIPVK